MNKTIFTFWEPKEKIPPYLQLCMETWKKYLPEYKIIVLDYNSVEKWLPNFCSADLCDSYGLAQQADAIRCALLSKYGGVWMDCDTIITSDKIREFLEIDAEVIMIEVHIGFIIAKKKNSFVMRNWNLGIKKHRTWKFLFKYVKFIRDFINKFLPKLSMYIRYNNWAYLGNIPLAAVLRKANKKQFYSIDKEKYKLLPEVNYSKENNIEDYFVDNYKKFYFEKELSEYALDGNNGIIYLHNSWTPDVYKEMSKEEFLKQNITLAKLLNKVLNI